MKHQTRGLLELLLLQLLKMLVLIRVKVVRYLLVGGLLLLMLLHLVLEHLVGEIESSFVVDVVRLSALSNIDVPKAQQLVALDLDLSLTVSSCDCSTIRDFFRRAGVYKLLALRRKHRWDL